MGIGDCYTEMQPTSMQKIDKTLIGTRLDICEKYYLDKGGSELRWSKSKVVLISDGSNIIKQGARTACYRVGEGVLILWDTNEERNESSSTSALRLLPSKWNPKGKHSYGA